MFWARAAALRPLLELGLSFSDFPPETAQTDGTLGHAIERLYLYACERAGFGWLKLANPALYIDTRTMVEITSPTVLGQYVMKHSVRLSGPNPPTRLERAPPVIEDVPPGLSKALAMRLAGNESAN
jgi:hypothetical protein